MEQSRKKRITYPIIAIINQPWDVVDVKKIDFHISIDKFQTKAEKDDSRDRNCHFLQSLNESNFIDGMLRACSNALCSLLCAHTKKKNKNKQTHARIQKDLTLKKGNTTKKKIDGKSCPKLLLATITDDFMFFNSLGI